jgi:hypothetical protein
MKGRLIALTFALGAFILNPMIACESSEDKDFTFGETEMRAVVTGTYSGVVTNTGEAISLTVDEAAATGTSTVQGLYRLQCESRSFVRPAAACIVETTMSLQGDVSSENDAIANGKLTGVFVVGGSDLSNGYVELTLESGGTIRASYDDASETLVDWTFQDPTSTVEQPLSVERETES